MLWLVFSIKIKCFSSGKLGFRWEIDGDGELSGEKIYKDGKRTYSHYVKGISVHIFQLSIYYHGYNSTVRVHFPKRNHSTAVEHVLPTA